MVWIGPKGGWGPKRSLGIVMGFQLSLFRAVTKICDMEDNGEKKIRWEIKIMLCMFENEN